MKYSRVLANFLGFEILEHQPHSSDLAPMDFRVFPEFKGMLPGMRFEDARELCIYAKNVVSSYTSDWFSDIYAKWLQILVQRKYI